LLHRIKKYPCLIVLFNDVHLPEEGVQGDAAAEGQLPDGPRAGVPRDHGDLHGVLVAQRAAQRALSPAGPAVLRVPHGPEPDAPRGLVPAGLFRSPVLSRPRRSQNPAHQVTIVIFALPFPLTLSC